MIRLYFIKGALAIILGSSYKLDHMYVYPNIRVQTIYITERCTECPRSRLY